MKDFLGRDLNLGDEVVFVQLNYRNLLKGTIVKTTKQMIFIEHPRTNVGGTLTRQFPEQVVKV